MERSKLYKILGIIVGVIVLIILLVVVFTLVNGNKVSYSDVESRIKEATKEYYQAHTDLLPDIGKSSTVSDGVLTSEGYLDSLSTLIKKETCNGTGKVFNNGISYTYSSSLDCGKSYSSFGSVEYLVGKNEIKVDGSGLYEEVVAYPVISEEGKITDYIYNANPIEVTRWVYKGSNPNNNIKIGKSWFYIISFSEQDIRLVKKISNYVTFDESYNEETDDYDGKNIYQTSGIISDIAKDYGEFNDTVKSLTIPHTVCIGSRLVTSLESNGKTECREVLVNQKYSLIAAYETILPSLDVNCKANIKSCANSNYLANFGNTWTVTPDAESSHRVLGFNGELRSRLVSGSSNYLLTITIDPNVKITGSGTDDDPFVVVTNHE